jgi:photosynthetic reaction center H subunit
VRSILSKQFDGVPDFSSPDQITLLEEDRISAYYAGGTLYAEPSRLEPKL